MSHEETRASGRSYWLIFPNSGTGRATMWIVPHESAGSFVF
jgi:hypothetical protein